MLVTSLKLNWLSYFYITEKIVWTRYFELCIQVLFMPYQSDILHICIIYNICIRKWISLIHQWEEHRSSLQKYADLRAKIIGKEGTYKDSRISSKESGGWIQRDRTTNLFWYHLVYDDSKRQLGSPRKPVLALENQEHWKVGWEVSTGQ